MRQGWRVMGFFGSDKRRALNQISAYMVLVGGVAVACFGYSLLGWVGAIVGFLVGIGLITKAVQRGRFFR
jgi:hypothetical protein